MLDNKNMMPGKFTVYASAWLVYILFTLLAYPIFSITVMLFSITLSIVGAWLYSYSGWLFTTLLTIPFHYVMLAHSSDDPLIWNEALNPFGIATQLFISGIIALLKSAKDKLDHLNRLLEEKVEMRTKELNRLRHYIIENHKGVQTLLNQTLLKDLGESLSEMLKESEYLVTRLTAEGKSESIKAGRLNSLAKKSITLIHSHEFINHFVTDEQATFSSSVRKLTDNFQETAGTDFELEFEGEYENFPKSLQYQLYRITHEAVTNAIRHAKASLILIQLELKENSYYLTVVNNGKPMPAEPELGLGIKLMQYHAHQVDGSIGFDTTPKGLTRFRCIAPQPLIKSKDTY